MPADSDDVHCPVPADRLPRCIETEEAESGIDSAFYESVALHEDIIEVFGVVSLFLQNNTTGLAGAGSLATDC
jgi:hypothetical protein